MQPEKQPPQGATPDSAEKLRLQETADADALQIRFEREKRAEQLGRESNLEGSLAPFRVGSVPYLNGAPLTRGIEEQILFEPPSRLAELLRADALDAGLVSAAEVLLTDRYDVLDGIAIASLGEVQSVLLAHRIPLEQITRVHCDTASITSVNLLRVLFKERNQDPEFVPLESYDVAPDKDAVLLIGDPAIEFSRQHHPHSLWDLGTAWYELTNLPFVYAVWALRRGIDNRHLRHLLREARDFGMDTLDSIIADRPEFDYEFRKDYLGWHIHFHLGADERRGLKKFGELLQKHTGQTVYPVRLVS